MIRRFGALLFWIGLIASTAIGQNDPVTETQLLRESEYIRANQLKLLGKYEEALKIFEGIARVDKGNHSAQYEVARLCTILEKWDQAEKAIRTAIRIDPVQPWYRVSLADIMEAQGRFADGAEAMAELIRLRPDQQAFYQRRVALLDKAGQWEEAISTLESEEKAFGKSLDISSAKVAIYQEQGMEDAVLEEWRSLHEAFPDRPEYLKHQVDALVAIGRKDGLRELYDAILALDPDDTETRIKLAKLDLLTSSPAQQVRLLKPVLEDPNVYADNKVLALIPYIEKLSNDQDTSLGSALVDAGRYLTVQYPYNAKCFALYADILNQLGRTTEAADAYAKTVALDDTNPIVWEQLLYSLEETGQYERLYDASEKAMDIFPNKAVHFLLHGAAQMARGNWDEAIVVSDQALLMAGKDRYVQIRARLQIARSHHMQGDKANRDASLQSALSLNDQHPEILRYLIGWAYLENQSGDLWMKSLESALGKFPEDGTLLLFEKIGTARSSDPETIFGLLPPAVRNDGYAMEWMGAILAADAKPGLARTWWKKAIESKMFHPETIYLIDRENDRQ